MKKLFKAMRTIRANLRELREMETESETATSQNTPAPNPEKLEILEDTYEAACLIKENIADQIVACGGTVPGETTGPPA